MAEIIKLAPGEPCPEAQSGDVLLIKGTGWLSHLIMLAEPYSHVITRTRPHYADAQARGVVRRPVETYEEAERVLVRVDAAEADRQQMEAFAESVLRAKWRYSYLGFAVTALMMLTGGRLSVRRYNTSYCSGLAAETLVRAGYIFEKPPSSVTPGDLARHFGVTA